MAVDQLSKVVEHLRSILAQQDATGMTNGDLLNRFVKKRDEAALEALLRRHGPMVMGVCRRVLHNLHDAEDAFQATFRVLLRKASSLQSPGTFGCAGPSAARNVAGGAASRRSTHLQGRDDDMILIPHWLGVALRLRQLTLRRERRGALLSTISTCRQTASRTVP